MKRLIRSIVLVGLMVVGGTERLRAQDLGAILDWLHKLSGPRFVGAGLTGSVAPAGESGIRLRLTGVYRTSISESGEVTPADANITMISVQPAVEFPVSEIDVDFGVGFALHRFGGDADGFWHYSVPVYMQYRPRKDWRVVPLLGIGVHVFPKFDQADFAPLNVTVSRQDAEAVLQIFAGVSIRPTIRP
jgi:hypothetical protein